VKNPGQFKKLEDRLAAYDPDVATVIRRVLYEEQRKLALKNPRDIVSLVEKAIDEAVLDDGPAGGNA
jgi:hypothetical protein